MRMTTIARRLGDFRQGLAYAGALFSERITVESAAASVRARTAERTGSFLDTLERGIFGYSDSPFRALLEAAGYDLSGVRRLVAHLGLEAALSRLARDGVYVAIEEFKGLREARRGDETFRFGEHAFANPLVSSGLAASSGGTRSQGIRTTISVSNHFMGAEHLAVALGAYGIEKQPFGVYLPQAHGASLWAVLALAALGNPPQQWFTQLPGRLGSEWETYSYFLGIETRARLAGITLPRFAYVPAGEEMTIVRWLQGAERRGGAGLFTTPSSALRISLAARREGARLPHATFVTIGEPLTSTKHATIASVGARAFSSLGFTEFGRATYGCAAADGSDDSHVVRDAVAVVQRRRPVDELGTEVESLMFTTVRPDARRILLNVETGDYATLAPRSCGCPLEALGWTEHMAGIRSFEKLNAEGRLFFGTQLITLIEDTLPRQFGGDLTDYQLVEQEDRDGFTRLDVLVHPRLGPIDEQALVARLDRELGHASNWATSALMKDVGTVRVFRTPPLMTKAGKLMPLHHLRLEQRLPGG